MRGKLAELYPLLPRQAQDPNESLISLATTVFFQKMGWSNTLCMNLGSAPSKLYAPGQVTPPLSRSFSIKWAGWIVVHECNSLRLLRHLHTVSLGQYVQDK